MTPNRHRIQRQIVELTLGDAASAPGAQEALARACREPLIAGMTTVFDAIAPSDVLLRLDKLEIDVGRLAGRDWAEQFQIRVIAELDRQLEKMPRTAASGADAGGAARGGDFEAFVYFLRRGRLPWWGGAPEQGWSKVVAESAPGRLRDLGALLREESAARTRAVDSLDDGCLQLLVSSLGGPMECERALRELRPAEAAATLHRWRRQFWRGVLEHSSLPGMTMTGGAALVRRLMRERCALVFEQGREGRASQAPATSEVPQPMRAVDVLALPEHWRRWCESAASAEESLEPATMSASSPARAQKSVTVPELRVVDGTPANDAEPIYLPCAGLLLVHPFLETLFRDRDLLDGQSFADGEARQRATLLLGYLATGRAETPEYELGMAKLLTGIGAEAPVESAWLDEADISACDELLEAVLGHWTALRSSSAAWLRSQFFLRDARLECVDDGYRVTVERRAQDVLLARLPWGIGVIGLPWLRERIFVQWLD